MADFKLSARLASHDSDVKAVSFPSPDTVLSASRDGSVRIWNRTSSAPPVFEPTVSSQTSEFVNSVGYLPPSADFPQGLILSGGKDTFVEVRQPQSSASDNAERLLVGHSQNVCSLDVSPTGNYIVSGGWDFQALVWSTSSWENQVRLGGHDKAVWAVLAWDDHTVLTGCADGCIRIFDLRKAIAGEAEAQSTITAPDVVRALCRVPRGHPSGADIASASNDGIIRLWKLNGQQVGELVGHENFIYSLTSLPSGELVSSGEDRTLRVWKGNDCIQTITHPAISVWAVAVCQESGDIVSGSSDGIARVFTRSSERTADAATLADFEESIKASAIPQQQVPDINKEKLPGPDFLTTRSGTKEGQVQMINEGNGTITAHQWSMSQQQWINIGTVVDAAASSGKKTEYNGKSYDFVFDVDIEDGKPPLKLPYNLSENPYEAATRFLGDNELPMTYLDNVANFITQNTQGATLGQSSQGEADPYGTESRYRPGESAPRPKVLPQSEYLGITAAKFDAMINKILQINGNMISSGRKDAALNPTQQNDLKEVREAIETSQPINQFGLDLAVGIVTKWTYSDRLPGLDLLRCMVPSPLVAKYSSDEGSILQIAINSATTVPDGGSPNENSVMLALRSVANIFASPEGRQVAAREANISADLLERVVGISDSGPIGQNNRNVLIAATTVLINYAVLSHKEKSALAGPGLPKRFLGILGKILTPQNDSEVLYRGLVALGTFAVSYKAEAVSQGAESWVNTARDKAVEPRVKAVGSEVLERLR
ncbi:ubiquitin homeostasis protein lub1 [Sodiomyces alkalinus F11]|uniref:Ubiquitin homeostasis protein lub1 n=1 Tax=Sodiomyces alkalinus (strain CBS 110278 / VKM F-3762 / F11) TaxID=1314773 RepID=A0A3N2Q4C4_SODAK|nr:ubiquitin homeostasis protein lub1 [Sodiomyces alkalinus F11]ROT41624.1 ubiquitin homeostasis protein lub1 [Sodiomyces alkalinus F11]